MGGRQLRLQRDSDIVIPRMRGTVIFRERGSRRALLVPAVLIALLGVGSSARAQAPSLREVPGEIAEPSRSQLVRRHTELRAKRESIAAEVRAHNERCSDVPEGSASERPCEAAQRRLNATIANYRAAVEAFNEAVGSAPRARP